MAENLHADAVVANNGCSTPSNAQGVADGVWTDNTTDNISWDCLWSIADPSGGLTGGATQTVEVLARKSATGGNGDPTATVELHENGSLVKTLVSSTALLDGSNPDGVVLSGTFTDADLSGDGTGVEIKVVSGAVGGQPAGRRNSQVDSIKWIADVTAGSGASSTPGTGSTLMTGLQAAVFAGVAVVVGAGSLLASGLAPSPSSGALSSPSTAVVNVVGHAPTVSTDSGGVTVDLGLGQVSVSGLNPDVSGGASSAPGNGSLTVSGQAVSLSLGTSVTAGAGSLLSSGLAPVVDLGGETPERLKFINRTYVRLDGGTQTGNWYWEDD